MPHQLAIIGSGKGWHSDALVLAGQRAGHHVVPVPYKDLVGIVSSNPSETSLSASGINLLRFDSAIVRSVPGGTLEQVILRVDALHRLESHGVRVVNPARAIEASVDKYLATSKLAAAGLAVPKTIACESARDAVEAFETLGRDVVIKPLFGSEGKGIVRVTDRLAADEVARSLEQTGAVALVQEFIPHPGFDLRVFVLGEQAIAGMRRWIAPGEFRANVSQGGRAEKMKVDDSLAETAVRAVRAVGALLGGVDLIQTPDGRTVVIEVNSSPGFRALEQATGQNIARAMVDLVTTPQATA